MVFLSKGSIAQEAYNMITEIMHIDNTFDDLSATERKKQRQLVLSEKVEAYFAWAKQKYSQVTHNSTIGKALAYSINQEEYLRVFLSDGHVPMDNNYAEQAIRPGNGWCPVSGLFLQTPCRLRFAVQE